MKRTLFTIALIIVTNLGTYLVSDVIFQQKIAENAQWYDGQKAFYVKALKAYENRIKLDWEYITMTKEMGDILRNNDLDGLAKLERESEELMPKFEQSNKELEQLKNDASANN